MRVVLTGAGGMLGTDLQTAFQDTELLALTKNELDITDLSSVLRVVEDYQPQLIINGAAFTKVDDCESRTDLAYAVNAIGPRNLAVAARLANAALVQISTDYVFPGVSDQPYREYDVTGPQSEYGKSKLAGEQMVRDLCPAHYIVRTSWLYGQHGPNFVKTMLRVGLEQGKVRVVDDQIGSPTYTADLAAAVRELVNQPAYGIYHLSNQGTCSWYQFACDIFAQAGVAVQVEAMNSSELDRPAPRPAYSVMDNRTWRLSGHLPLRHYREALAEYLL